MSHNASFSLYRPVEGMHRFLDGFKGFLYRKSQLDGTWKQRYFVLEQKKFKCYEDDSCAKLTSEMTFFKEVDVFDIPGESENRSNLFYFSASMDDVYYLSSDYPQEKSMWLEAISDAKRHGFKLIDQPRLEIEPFYPSVDLVVNFKDSSIVASNDNKLQPHIIEHAPTVVMRFAKPNRIYSLLMIDLDSVRGNTDSRSYYLHWGIVNIEGDDISSGLELSPYESPAPEYGSGLHRFVILLFDQSSDFTPDQFEKLDEMFAHREHFSHIDWMRTFHLTAPVGITGFYSGWEETCDALHERMGYVPAPMYFSPKMEAEAEAARTEQARVDLFRDFVLSDIFPPDVVDPSKPPPLGTIALTIEYDNEYTVEDGQKIPASQAEREPAVAFYPHPTTFDANGNPECNLYTLLLVDPDAPSRIHHDMREFIYWAVLNIDDADVAKGDLALSYMGPAPAYASGLHRYVFCLYKQNKPFSPAQVKQNADFFSVRKGICSFDWVTSQQDILQVVPVGVEAFLSEWDLSVDDAHAAMGYMPPEQFWSPSQRRSAVIAEADAARTGSSPMFSITGGQDMIKTRLQQIQEANDRFNQQVTASSRVNIELGTLSNPNSPKGFEEHTFDAKTDAEAAAAAAAQREAQNAPKKVASRNPVTLGGATKSLSSKDAANAPLSVSLTEDSSASAAAALRESAEDKTAMVTSSREETNNSSVSVAKRAEHHTDQTQKAHTVNENRRQSSDGQYAEERSESLNEQHHEERAEKSEFHQKSQSKTTSSPRGFSNAQSAETSVERVRSRELHEMSAREQQSQVKQLQIEAEQRQNEELQQQQQVRREQQAEMERQQREVLERQAQEQQRQLRLQQEQQEQEQQQRRAARRQREREEQENREREAQEQQQREQQEQQQRRAARRQREEQERERQQQEAYEQQMRSQTAPSSSRRQQQEEQNGQSASRSSTRSAPTGRAPDEHKDSSPQAKNRKDKKDRDFFSAPPDSEYSDTDNGSMLSSAQESDRYKQQAQQQSPQKGQKSSSTLRSQGHAAVDVDEAPSESDASSVLPALAPRGGDVRQSTRRADSSTTGGGGGGGGGGGSSQQRYKQLLEALATVKSASQLCDLFNVTTSTIFAGEKMKKKMNNDFMFKDSYIWVIPRTRTLHWSKTKGDAGDSKYLLLDTVTGVDPTAPPKGEFKGIVKRVRVSGPNLLITVESGDFLELKLTTDGTPPPQKRANDWATVIKAFTQG